MFCSSSIQVVSDHNARSCAPYLIAIRSTAVETQPEVHLALVHLRSFNDLLEDRVERCITKPSVVLAFYNCPCLTAHTVDLARPFGEPSDFFCQIIAVLRLEQQARFLRCDDVR